MLMGLALNFIWGTSVCCLLCLAHNRRTTLPYPSATTTAAAAAAVAAAAATTTAVTAAAAAGAPARIHADATATADAQAAAHSHLTAGTPVKANTQPTIVPKEEAKGTAEKEPSSKSTPFVGSAFSASQPSPSLKPSAHPAAFGWAPALAKPLSLNNSLIAWVQRNELWLLAAVSQEDAQLFASLLSAMFVGTRFLTSVANYSVPGIVAMSPTMDMLAIVLGMMMGGSPDMQGWAAAQRRAYRSVRGLLRNIMPAHVADALEAYETERDHARPMCTFGVSSSTVAQGQPFSHSRRASCTSIVSSWGQSSSHSRRASYSALVRLTKPWLGPSQPCEPCFKNLAGMQACKSACECSSGGM
ncbi:hypothetical protein DUNSADRAFT_13332 [Dunaliella salina]|uniref:Uncharacterized protein n=1 Tax=Dunaliella salina TaxID=3046 RepID=A0ABQ7G9J0_DUNSA|nr:hypothetical protein DUNSADRAFT_13332 [Dunaliella salina]|eukprot:KAF5831276.1 hypothetical protein DUNSADRAFT_13332 [Dunaliella salina]